MRFKDKLEIFVLVAGSVVWDLLPERLTNRIADWSANSPTYNRIINR